MPSTGARYTTASHYTVRNRRRRNPSAWNRWLLLDNLCWVSPVPAPEQVNASADRFTEAARLNRLSGVACGRRPWRAMAVDEPLPSRPRRRPIAAELTWIWQGRAGRSARPYRMVRSVWILGRQLFLDAALNALLVVIDDSLDAFMSDWLAARNHRSFNYTGNCTAAADAFKTERAVGREELTAGHCTST